MPRRRPPSRALAGAAFLMLASCTAPAADPGFEAATDVASRVRTQLARVSDTAFRPYVSGAPTGIVLRVERDCRAVARIPLPVPTIDSLDTGMGNQGSFLDDLAIPPSTCDSIMRVARRLEDTLTVIPIIHDGYGATDTVAATTILALHEWFHHAWFENGHRVPDRLMRRAAGSFASEDAATEPAGVDALRGAAREALAEALMSPSRAGRSAALQRYRCARQALFAGDTTRDLLAQVRETVEGPAIIASLRAARELGLIAEPPRDVIVGALRGRLWARQDSARSEPGREFHYTIAAALTLLMEADVPGAVDSLRRGARLEELVVPRRGRCPST